MRPPAKSLAVAAAFLAAWFAGCSSPPAGRNVELTRSDELNDVARMIQEFMAANGRPPARAAELAQYGNMYPFGARALQSGDVVVVDGARVLEQDGREVVVAYEKKVPTEGGLVLLETGKVKEMSADQFKSAPKGGK